MTAPRYKRTCQLIDWAAIAMHHAIIRPLIVVIRWVLRVKPPPQNP